MNNEKNSYRVRQHSTTLKPIVFFDPEYFRFEVLKDYYRITATLLQGGNIHNGGTTRKSNY